MLAVSLGLLAALGWGASSVFARSGLRYMRVPTGAFVSLVSGFTVAMTLALVLHSGEIRELDSFAFVWFFLAGILSFPLGRLLNFAGLSLIGVSRASPIVGSSPLFATILAVALMGESVNTPILIGTASIVTGLFLILSQR